MDLQLGIFEWIYYEVTATEPFPEVSIGENHYMASTMEVAYSDPGMEASDFSALWAAFRGRDRDRVIVGVAAAFAHVAAANGAIDQAETARFIDVVRGSRLAPPDGATADDLTRAFEALAQAMVARPELGRSESLRVLADFGFDPMRSEIIWSATRAALVADAQLDPAERRAADEIRQALRIRAG